MAQNRVLCFGDSLTKGLYHHPETKKYEEHPYSLTLVRLLGDGACVVTAGKEEQSAVPGDLAERLRGLLEVAEEKYDVVVILGGTNDINPWGGPSALAIFGAVRDLHVLAHSHGARTVLVTIPEFGDTPDDARVEKFIAEINEPLLEWAAEHTDKVAVADVKKELPQLSLSEDEKERLWDLDRTHLSPAGYDRMGEIIFPAVKALLDGMQ